MNNSSNAKLVSFGLALYWAFFVSVMVWLVYLTGGW